MYKNTFLIFCFTIFLISCKNEKIKEKEIKVQKDTIENIQNNKITTILPTDIDSINVLFTRDRFFDYTLHVNKSEYLLLDKSQSKTYNLNILKDSLDKYLVDLFINENAPIILEKIKKNEVISSKEKNTMSITLYYTNATTKDFYINFKDDDFDYKYSKTFINFNNLLSFVWKAPENLEKRLSKRKQFQKSIKDKRNDR